MQITLKKIVGTDVGYLPIGTVLDLPPRVSDMAFKLCESGYADVTEEFAWLMQEGEGGKQGQEEDDKAE
ncbi:hypothetical protein CMI37_13130 [Candidatus Pacearchaeota archaeon]|jgi:hypothetical protein|nr:hypothetical protein [Candidatus Pacearchaeota archaeon]